MEIIIFFGPAFVCIIIFYYLIKAAVSKGIDSSTEIQLLKSELRELNGRLKKIEGQQKVTGSNIDKKI